MKHLSTLLLVLGIAALTACQQKTTTPAAATTSTPAVIVNGKPISTETFDFYVKNRANRATTELSARTEAAAPR